MNNKALIIISILVSFILVVIGMALDVYLSVPFYFSGIIIVIVEIMYYGSVLLYNKK